MDFITDEQNFATNQRIFVELFHITFIEQVTQTRV